MNKKFILSLIALTLGGIALAQTKPEYGNNPRVGKYVDIRGFKMYYEIYGTGKPLLFIHGNSGSMKDFSKQVPYFSKEYKVILADSRAQGKSADNGDSLSYEMMADDFDALLDKLKIDSCYVIGWSDGGNNGLLLAMRHPGKVKKLAITGANLWPDSTAVESTVLNWATWLSDSLSKIKHTRESKNQYKLIHMVVNEPNISPKELQAVKCPTLVIGGDHDILLPKHTLLIAESIPRSYLWIIPNSGHSTPIHYSRQFNETINEFFKKPYRIIEGMDRMN